MKIKLRKARGLSPLSLVREESPALFLEVILGAYGLGPTCLGVGTVLVKLPTRTREARRGSLEEIRCRICDSALSVAGGPVEGEYGGALPGSTEVRLETDGSGQYFRCPYCSARNVTIVTTAGDGRPGMRVAWAVMNGD